MNKAATCFGLYDQYENEFVAELNQHPFFITEQFRLTNQAYQEYLIQLGHFSFGFINWLQTGLLSLTDASAKEVVRHILREEIPSNKPMHQEERVADMTRAEISLERILSSQPTSVTTASMQRRYKLINYSEPLHELKTLVAFRFDGEVLAAEIFHHISNGIARRFGSDPAVSRYYTPHYLHDQKSVNSKRIGHSDAYTGVLSEMINDEVSLEAAKRQLRRALSLRLNFHDQFV